MYEEVSGRDLSWFFDDLIKTNKKIDYKIASVSARKSTVKVKNLSSLTSPFSLALMEKDSIIEERWIENIRKDSTIDFPSQKGQYFRIDPRWMMADIDRRNNTYQVGRIWSKTEIGRAHV